MADDVIPPPAVSAPSGGLTAALTQHPGLPADRAGLAATRNDLRRQLNDQLEDGLRTQTQRQVSLKADQAAATARIEATRTQLDLVRDHLKGHEAEIARLEAATDPLAAGDLDDKIELGEDLARQRAAAEAQRTVVEELEADVATQTRALADFDTELKAVDTEWAVTRAAFEATEVELDRLDDKIMLLADEDAARDAAEAADASAAESEAAGDTVAAAHSRAIAQQHTAEADVARAAADSIQIDIEVLADAGLDVSQAPPLDAEADAAPPGPGTQVTATPVAGEPEIKAPGTDTPEPGTTDGTPTGVEPPEIEMDPEHVGTSAEGAALASEAAQLRARLLARLEHDQAELGGRADRAGIELKGARAALAEAETSVAQETERRDQIAEDETALWKKLAGIDEDTDPAAYNEVLEEIQVHSAAANRQMTLIEANEAEVGRLRTQVGALEQARADAEGELTELGGSLRDAEAEIDKMENRAALLNTEDQHTRNAREYTDMAAAATAAGDRVEAARLRARAVEELDAANATSRSLADLPLDPTKIDAAGLRDDPAGSVEPDAPWDDEPGMGATPLAGAAPAEDPLGTADLAFDAEAAGVDDPLGASAIVAEIPSYADPGGAVAEPVDGPLTPAATVDGEGGGGTPFEPAPGPAYDAEFDPGYTESYQEPEPAPYDEPLDAPIDEASSFTDPTEGY
jgi:hypothetical protein